MRLMVCAVVLAIVAGGCTREPERTPAQIERNVRAELSKLDCAGLREAMAEALRARSGTAAEGARPGPASMFMVLPGPRTLGRVLSGGASGGADPETTYRVAHDIYGIRECEPKVPFGES